MLRAKAIKQLSGSPLTEIKEALFEQKGIRLFIKRDDLLKQEVFPGDHAFSGNKCRKMKYNLLHAFEAGYEQILTFGGAFSNHIAATAAAGRLFDIKTIGVIRGEEHLPLNPTLNFAKKCGMHFHYLDRSSYRGFGKYDPVFHKELKALYGNYYMVPEGGTNIFALKGCAEIVEEIRKQKTELKVDYYCSACGTGGTFAGMTTALTPGEKAMGFSVLKGDFMTGEVEGHLQKANVKSAGEWRINNDYHFGGFAKFKQELIDFMTDFTFRHGIALDPLYTGKLFFGLYDLIGKGYFEAGSTIVAIHTGGLQGVKGFNERFGLGLEVD